MFTDQWPPANVFICGNLDITRYVQYGTMASNFIGTKSAAANTVVNALSGRVVTDFCSFWECHPSSLGSMDLLHHGAVSTEVCRLGGEACIRTSEYHF